MKRLVLILLPALLAACSSQPTFNPDSVNDLPEIIPEPVPMSRQDPNQDLKSALGLGRSPADLGFVEKRFDPCRYGQSSEKGCNQRYMTVVHFQLLCRDSEGSVSDPGFIQPIVADRVTWQLGGLTGGTQTDGRGYGQFSLVTPHSTRNKRLILRIGPRFVGLEASEITKIVLPKNFCRMSHA